jgi:hypothetical protein
MEVIVLRDATPLFSQKTNSSSNLTDDPNYLNDDPTNPVNPISPFNPANNVNGGQIDGQTLGIILGSVFGSIALIVLCICCIIVTIARAIEINYHKF